ncbi:hypothetical protein AWENTII_008851 [Aspergillus wentii]
MSKIPMDSLDQEQQSDRDSGIVTTGTSENSQRSVSRLPLLKLDFGTVGGENLTAARLHVVNDSFFENESAPRNGDQRVKYVHSWSGQTIHELAGSWNKSWTSKETSFFWLRDSLPEHLPKGARILSFGYSGTPKAAADALLSELVDDRAKTSYVSGHVEKSESRNNDLEQSFEDIFILLGYSFGGYVAKQVSTPYIIQAMPAQ